MGKGNLYTGSSIEVFKGFKKENWKGLDLTNGQAKILSTLTKDEQSLTQSSRLQSEQDNDFLTKLFAIHNNILDWYAGQHKNILTEPQMTQYLQFLVAYLRMYQAAETNLGYVDQHGTDVIDTKKVEHFQNEASLILSRTLVKLNDYVEFLVNKIFTTNDNKSIDLLEKFSQSTDVFKQVKECFDKKNQQVLDNLNGALADKDEVGAEKASVAINSALAGCIERYRFYENHAKSGQHLAVICRDQAVALINNLCQQGQLRALTKHFENDVAREYILSLTNRFAQSKCVLHVSNTVGVTQTYKAGEFVLVKESQDSAWVLYEANANGHIEKGNPVKDMPSLFMFLPQSHKQQVDLKEEDLLNLKKAILCWKNNTAIGAQSYLVLSGAYHAANERFTNKQSFYQSCYEIVLAKAITEKDIVVLDQLKAYSGEHALARLLKIYEIYASHDVETTKAIILARLIQDIAKNINDETYLSNLAQLIRTTDFKTKKQSDKYTLLLSHGLTADFKVINWLLQQGAEVNEVILTKAIGAKAKVPAIDLLWQVSCPDGKVKLADLSAMGHNAVLCQFMVEKSGISFDDWLVQAIDTSDHSLVKALLDLGANSHNNTLFAQALAKDDAAIVQMFTEKRRDKTFHEQLLQSAREENVIVVRHLLQVHEDILNDNQLLEVIIERFDETGGQGFKEIIDLLLTKRDDNLFYQLKLAVTHHQFHLANYIAKNIKNSITALCTELSSSSELAVAKLNEITTQWSLYREAEAGLSIVNARAMTREFKEAFDSKLFVIQVSVEKMQKIKIGALGELVLQATTQEHYEQILAQEKVLTGFLKANKWPEENTVVDIIVQQARASLWQAIEAKNAAQLTQACQLLRHFALPEFVQLKDNQAFFEVAISAGVGAICFQQFAFYQADLGNQVKQANLAQDPDFVGIKKTFTALIATETIYQPEKSIPEWKTLISQYHPAYLAEKSQIIALLHQACVDVISHNSEQNFKEFLNILQLDPEFNFIRFCQQTECLKIAVTKKNQAITAYILEGLDKEHRQVCCEVEQTSGDQMHIVLQKQQQITDDITELRSKLNIAELVANAPSPAQLRRNNLHAQQKAILVAIKDDDHSAKIALIPKVTSDKNRSYDDFMPCQQAILAGLVQQSDEDNIVKILAIMNDEIQKYCNALSTPQVAPTVTAKAKKITDALTFLQTQANGLKFSEDEKAIRIWALLNNNLAKNTKLYHETWKGLLQNTKPADNQSWVTEVKDHLTQQRASQWDSAETQVMSVSTSPADQEALLTQHLQAVTTEAKTLVDQHDPLIFALDNLCAERSKQSVGLTLQHLRIMDTLWKNDIADWHFIELDYFLRQSVNFNFGKESSSSMDFVERLVQLKLNDRMVKLQQTVDSARAMDPEVPKALEEFTKLLRLWPTQSLFRQDSKAKEIFNVLRESDNMLQEVTHAAIAKDKSVSEPFVRQRLIGYKNDMQKSEAKFSLEFAILLVGMIAKMVLSVFVPPTAVVTVPLVTAEAAWLWQRTKNQHVHNKAVGELATATAAVADPRLLRSKL